MDTRLNEAEVRELLRLMSAEEAREDFPEVEAQLAELRNQTRAISEATGTPLEEVERAAAAILNRRLPPDGAPTPVEALLAPSESPPSRRSDIPWLLFVLCFFGLLLILAALALGP